MISCHGRKRMDAHKAHNRSIRTQRFVFTTLAHNSMNVYMLTSDTVTHNMLTTDTQPRTQLHDVNWEVFDFA